MIHNTHGALWGWKLDHVERVRRAVRKAYENCLKNERGVEKFTFINASA